MAIAKTYEYILFDRKDRVGIVTFNRPDRLNAWTYDMNDEMHDAIEACNQDPGIGAIIVTGAGRGFCAGADMQMLSSVAGAKSSEAELRQALADWLSDSGKPDIRPDFKKTYSYFPSISKPILAAINGPAAGLGLVIALYCDLRFASDGAKFSTAFARRGLIAEHGISWMLPRLVGIANALDLLLSARSIDAAEALRMGLVGRVLPQENFLDGVRAYALELANMVSPRSMRIIKRQVYEALFQNLAEAVDDANQEMLKSFTCQDFQEGVAHFLEKRAPAFTGK
jgi:enoyl-CoA hydratase/carnithine racemase